MSGGGFSLQGTAGQADSGQMSGGDLTLIGGFLNPSITEGPGTVSHRVLMPMIRRGP